MAALGSSSIIIQQVMDVGRAEKTPCLGNNQGAANFISWQHITRYLPLALMAAWAAG
jgi:hypothetical protein